MLEKIKEKVSGLFKNNFDNKKTIGLSIFAILLLVISYFIFKKYIYPKLNPTYVANKEFQQTEESAEEVSKTPDIVKVYFFAPTKSPFMSHISQIKYSNFYVARYLIERRKRKKKWQEY